ncbi:hypothetical protein HK105_204007 [Polyrhizophydium stewartii]|uniref:RING-type E3 ubiquitin transferase n=1 Tax=Polyrhizophydium stewartii TaxID=2732419 RepID=A0ABR4NAS9_9FUNG
MARAGAGDDDEEVCVICAEPIVWSAVGVCNHDVCHICSLRMRALYKRPHCSLCKTELDKVVFRSKSLQPFESFDLSVLKKDERLSIYFETPQIYDETMVLLRFNCPEADCPKFCAGGWGELKNHVKTEHHLLMCELCTRFKKVFTHEHTLFTSESLRRHNLEGDPDDPSFKGHPECGFCRIRFYGADELFEHCREKHEQCFLCVRRGVQNQYYINYPSLEEHFGEQHFRCTDRECLDKKFVVFDSEIDLKAHELEAHASSKTRARGAQVVLNFDYGGPSGSQSNASADSTDDSDGQRGRGSRRFNVPAGFGTALTSAPPQPPAAIPEPAAPVLVDPTPAQAPARTAARLAAATASGFGTMLSPTPAESAALQGRQSNPTAGLQEQQKKKLERDLALEGEPDIVASLQRLFGTSQTSATEFKRLMRDFRQSSISASEFLDGFTKLTLVDKHGPLLEDARQETGRVWMRLIDTFPEEGASDADASDAAAGRANAGKKKKKGISLSEFEAMRRSMPKKEAMLRAWNDYKAKVRQENNVVPIVASSTAWGSQPFEASAPLPSSMTSNARVLQIKSSASRQRQAILHSRSSAWQNVVPGARTTTDITFANFTRPATSPTMRREASGSAPTPTVVQPVQPVSIAALVTGRVNSNSSGAGVKIKSAEEFPSLPKSAKPQRVTVEMLRAQRGGVPAPAAPAPVAWGEAAGGASSGFADDEDADRGAPSSGGKKKGKKTKQVLMHFG